MQNNDQTTKRFNPKKAFGKRCGVFFLRGSIHIFFLLLTALITLFFLDYSEKRRISFYPPDSISEYLSSAHVLLEEIADKKTTLDKTKTIIPAEAFPKECIEIVKPIEIHSDEYGVYLTTHKSWQNGEHGIFIAKDENNMPPDLNWGLIEGRVFTYAVFD